MDSSKETTIEEYIVRFENKLDNAENKLSCIVFEINAMNSLNYMNPNHRQYHESRIYNPPLIQITETYLQYLEAKRANYLHSISGNANSLSNTKKSIPLYTIKDPLFDDDCVSTVHKYLSDQQLIYACKFEIFRFIFNEEPIDKLQQKVCWNGTSVELTALVYILQNKGKLQIELESNFWNIISHCFTTPRNKTLNPNSLKSGLSRLKSKGGSEKSIIKFDELEKLLT